MNAEWTLADSGAETVDLGMSAEQLPDGSAVLAETGNAGGGHLFSRLLAGFGGHCGGGHPWFLVSGLLMFVGCYLVNVAVHDRPDELGPVLVLIGVFMVYEWLVLGLGVWLWRRAREGGAAGEAGHLLGLAVLLLADTTFVYNELAIADLTLGAGVGFLAGSLGVLKLWLIARVVGIRLGVAGWVASAGGVGVVFALPVFARAVGGTTGGLPAWAATSVWWGAAGLVTLTLWVLSDAKCSSTEHAEAKDPQRFRGLRGLMVALPTGSALLHLLAMHWVYNETWTAGHLSPMLLGLSVVLLVRSGWGSAGPRWVAGVCGVVGAWSAAGGESFFIEWNVVDMEWSTLRGWLLVAGLAYGLVWWKRRSLVLLMVWPTLWVLAGLGASPGMIAERVAWAVEESWRSAGALLPKGLLAWGITVMALAFATLGLGAWLSGRGREGGLESMPPNDPRHRNTPTPE